MDQILLWISLAAGLLTVLNILARAHWQLSRARADLAVEAPAILVVLGAAAVTLLQQSPFSSGQTMWSGLVLGAAVTLFGSAAALPIPGSTVLPGQGTAAWSARFGAAAAGMSLLLLLYAARALDVLVAYSLGALTFAILFAGALRLTRPDNEQAEQRCAAAEATALLVVTLATATYLATFHRSPTGVREWQPLPALLAAAAGLLLSVRSLVTAPAGRTWLYGVLIVGIPLAAIAWIIAIRLNGSLPFLWVVLLGLGLFTLISGLDHVGSPPTANEPAASTGIGASRRLISALLVIGGAVIAFRELHGFGLALLVLAGFVAAAVFAGERFGNTAQSSVVPPALTLGLAVVLYRVFVERNDYTRGFQPDFLYYYTALLLGALLPTLLANLAVGQLSLARSQPLPVDGMEPRRTVGPALLRMGLLGAVAGLLPLAVWMLVGDRPQAAMLVGLAVAALGVVGTSASDELLGSDALQRLLIPTVALSAVQFTHLLAPLALRTRAQRLEILAGVTVAILLGIAVAGWWERRRPQASVASRSS